MSELDTRVRELEVEHWQAEYKAEKRIRDIADAIRSNVGSAMDGLPVMMLLDKQAFDNPDGDLVIGLMPLFQKAQAREPGILLDFDFNFSSDFRRAWAFTGRVADLLGAHVAGVPVEVRVGRGTLKIYTVPAGG